jgi:hypothetical protein
MADGEPDAALPRRRVLQAFAASMAGTPLVLPALAAAAPAAAAPGRTALVIGNDRYPHNPLNNATNDARAMADLLAEAGFAVDLKLNATRAQMVGAIDAFGLAVAQRDVGTALFYYAGHAAQLDSSNYMLPVDGNIASAADIGRQCVDLGLLIGKLGRAPGRTALIFLDACRDDPFGPRFRTGLKGMSPYDAPAGTLLAFATAPGKVAVEVVGNTHGLYTEHLVRELKVKGRQLEDALKVVRANVRMASGGEQVPWESTSLERDVYLFPTQKLSEAELERQSREELEAWARIRASQNPADWADFLRRFPGGKFAELAQANQGRLMARKEPAPAVARPAQASSPAPASGPASAPTSRPASGPTSAPASKPASAPAPAGAQKPAAAPPPPPPALRLGPKLAVPARFKGSGNPHSAGSYPFRPIWTPGDEYVFNDLVLHSGKVLRTWRLVVKRVDLAANRVEYTNGSLIDLNGSLLRDGRTQHFDPPNQVNPAELQVGRKWSSRFKQDGASAGTGEYAYRITGRETITVPAGEFSAFRIHGEGWFMGPFVSNRGIHMTRWVVPGINLSVRQELHHLGSARVMVSARQAMVG